MAKTTPTSSSSSSTSSESHASRQGHHVEESARPTAQQKTISPYLKAAFPEESLSSGKQDSHPTSTSNQTSICPPINQSASKFSE
ncbi:hypothetical protein EJ08DRAFT_474232 [Tothia fuscella]|uniref:Uncharacterized protein n=1 Tax=Tothia fuscella TaxID=1048955 RepID=A0A9P4P0V7_9PEZI|nr:hypothetical protein EJ08DRAFT_474232 [Tothia fuscella]